MKKTLLLITVLIALDTFAQKVDGLIKEAYPINTKLTIKSEQSVLNDRDARNVLRSNFLRSEKDGLKLKSHVSSPYGEHYTFIQTYGGIEVYQAKLKLNTDKDGQVTSILNSFQDMDAELIAKWPEVSDVKLFIPMNYKILESKKVWAMKNNFFVPSLLLRYSTHDGLVFEQLFDESEAFHLEELTSHFAPIDTTAKALVYRPDPVTKTNTYYVGSYKDYQDQTNACLDAARDTVEIQISYDNGIFSLENDHVKIVEKSSPQIEPVTNSEPYFYYDRSQSGFEDVNVIYHVTKAQEYIRSLGFTNIVDYQIEIDCHGFDDADQSTFYPTSSPPSIVFGTGNVDDAEDAEVVVHEYSHAVMHSAAPSTNFGSERRAMDEAFGDYMAVSYSNSLGVQKNDEVFNWDGHNEFWDGRLASSSAQYPDDLAFDLYEDAPMWSASLLRIERNIGRDLTTQIAIQAAYSFSSNMTIAQAAQLVIQADSAINNGAHYGEICWVYKDNGMVSSCQVNRPPNMVLEPNDEEANSEIKLIDSEKFAQGTCALGILAPNKFELSIFEFSGKLLESRSSVNGKITVLPQDWERGSYLFRVETANEVKTFKVLKF